MDVEGKDGKEWTSFIWLGIGTMLQAIVNTVVSHRVPQCAGNSLYKTANISF
jgi:hypothetical protein